MTADETVGSGRFMKSKTDNQFLNLRDDEGLSWVWAFGDRSVVVNGVEHTIGPRFDEFVNCIARELAEFKPSVIENHHRTGTVLGLVHRARVLSKVEATELGIDQPNDRALYLGVRWNRTGAALYDAGEVAYMSVGLEFDKPDERPGFPSWPCYLCEISITSVPMLKADQVPVPALAGLQLSDGATMPETQNITPEAFAELAAGVAKTLAEIEALTQRIATIESTIANAKPAEPPAQELPAQDAPKTEPSAEANLRDEVSKLKRMLALRDAREATARELATRAHTPAVLDALTELRLADAAKAQTWINSLPILRTDRVSGGISGTQNTDVRLSDTSARPNEDLHRKVVAYRATNPKASYNDALIAVTASR